MAEMWNRSITGKSYSISDVAEICDLASIREALRLIRNGELELRPHREAHWRRAFHRVPIRVLVRFMKTRGISLDRLMRRDPEAKEWLLEHQALEVPS